MTTENSVTSFTPQDNGKNRSNQKEMVGAWSTIGTDPTTGELREIITARTYMARSADGAGPVYGSIWIHTPGSYAGGNGTARGYGYHKPSAAIDEALTSAGIKLARPIDGCGDSAMLDAFAAIARHLGYSHFITVRH